MLWTIFVVVLVLWLLGFSFHIAGGLIHLLLVVALIILIFNLVSGRRSSFVKWPEHSGVLVDTGAQEGLKPEDSIFPREVITFVQSSARLRGAICLRKKCAGAQPR